MSRVIVFSTVTAFVPFLFFSIPIQADEIEPEPVAELEPEPRPEPRPEPKPEPEPQAEPEPVPTRGGEFARNGIYLGAAAAGAGYTKVEDDLEATFGNAIPVDVEIAAGLDVRVGYRIHHGFAGEIQVQWFPEKSIKIANVNALDLESLTATANVKAYFHTGRAQPFLLVGVGLMHFEVKDSLGLGLKADGEGFAARFGGGMELYLNSNVVVVLEGSYVLPTGDVDDLDYAAFALGLQYRF